MIVDQDAHPPHHLPIQSRHGSRTAWHDRQALVPAWTPLAHAFAHSRSDGDQELSPKASRPFPAAWPRACTYHERPEAGWREACTGQVSRLAVCHMHMHMLVSELAAMLGIELLKGV